MYIHADSLGSIRHSTFYKESTLHWVNVQILRVIEPIPANRLEWFFCWPLWVRVAAGSCGWSCCGLRDFTLSASVLGVHKETSSGKRYEIIMDLALGYSGVCLYGGNVFCMHDNNFCLPARTAGYNFTVRLVDIACLHSAGQWFRSTSQAAWTVTVCVVYDIMHSLLHTYICTKVFTHTCTHKYVNWFGCGSSVIQPSIFANLLHKLKHIW